MADPAATRAFEPAIVEGFGAERAAALRASVFGCRFHFGRWLGVGFGGWGPRGLRERKSPANAGP